MSKNVIAAALCCLAAALLPACGASRLQARSNRITDARRIVTLMPSFAEDLCAMGEGARIVGVSQYGRTGSCARNAPVVGNFASIDAEKIVALHPDVVVGIPAQRRLVQALQRAGIRTLFLRDESYADIFSDIERLGSITGRERAARRLDAALRAKTRALQASEGFARRPSVFVVLQAQPIWTVGPQSYISTLLRLAGGRNAVPHLPLAYAQYGAEALIRLQPDAIVTGSDTNLPSLLSREPWRSLRAVREHRVFVIPDPGEIERPGPRYNEALSWLIDRLRPLSS